MLDRLNSARDRLKNASDRLDPAPDRLEDALAPAADRPRGFRERLDPARDRLKNAVDPAADRLRSVRQRLDPARSRLKDAIDPARDRLKDAIDPARGRLKDALEPAADRLNAVRDRLEPARDRLAGSLDRVDPTGVSRRRVLTAVPAAAGLAVLAGAAETGAAGPAKPDAAGPAPVPRATTRPRPVENAQVKPPPLRAQHKPVFTLGDYQRITAAPPFPSDAVALTIDDGPHPVWTPKILRLLDRHHVPALFCMIGNQVLGHETVAKSVVRAGHQLANHTWSHPTKLAHKSGAQVRKEIARAQEKIHDTTGHVPKLFRSPGGDWSSTVLQESAHAGLVPLDWSDDPRDWSRPGVAAIQRRLMAARPGQILLCHDGGGDRSQTYTALKTVIPALTARGYRFVAL